MTIIVDMIDAIKVQFIKPIFEDDFVEKGMKAWLVDVEWAEREKCYKLYFDFTEFEAENDKYFKATFYPNCYTKTIARVPCSLPKNLVGIPRNTPSTFRWAMVKNATMLRLPERL